jgi:UPF0716 protein FxsA
MPLLIFLYPLIELFLLVRGSQVFGFLNVLFFIIATGLLGLMLMIMIGQSAIRSLQSSFVSGANPSHKILNRGLMFVGAFLIFLPGVLTDILGLLFILPGFRHLISLYFKFLIAKGIAKGGIRIFKTAKFEREVHPMQNDTIEVQHKRIE